jgi:ribosomal protein S18 acetylase RimI-like enzyme
MPDAPTPLPDLPIKIRTYEPRDKAAVDTLYREGLIGGSIAPNDTGVDMADIPAAYLSSDDSHFWVAENDAGEVIGTIGVQRGDRGAGEIRRLRVRADSRRRGVGMKLMETAVNFCRERQCLKVTLDTYMEHEPAVRLFEKLHFNHTRTRKVGDKDVQYFYLDLYHPEPRRQR